jgi:cholera toxin transcriptional activator
VAGLARLSWAPQSRFIVALGALGRRSLTNPPAMLNYGVFFMSHPQPTSGGQIVRFGLFEADLAAGELRKGGIRIRLQEQPFQVLVQLLERPGEIVTREQLRDRLWPADTFVDFDHSLNTAINKIRDALDDSASNPRFVETLARRGYRFIAPVQQSDAAGTIANEPAIPNPQSDSPRSAQLSEARDLHPELEVPIPRRELTRVLFALIQFMYLVFYLGALWRWERIDDLVSPALPGSLATVIVVALWITALIGIPLRLYLLSAAAFDHRRLGENFRRLFLLILPLDQLWATAPFLLIRQIGVGLAFAATAALLYVPFSERTLVRLAYPSSK